MKALLVLIFSLCFITATLTVTSAQNGTGKGNVLNGYPVLKNYLPKDYKAHNQNWAITQDNRGVLFFGNSNGLLEFDGQTWGFISIPHGLVRSLACDSNGTVFIGSADDFGMLVRSAQAQFEYKSLKGFVPDTLAFGHVWYTFSISNQIFFITSSYIFRFAFPGGNYQKPVVEIIRSKERFRIAHKVYNDLYVVEMSQGLLKWNGKEFQYVEGSSFVTESTPYSVLPYDSKGSSLLIVNKAGEMFVYKNNTFTPFISRAGEYFREKGIYLPGARLPDNTFVFNTISGGIIIIDAAGEVLRIIDSKIGLPDDGVLYTFYTNNKLWLALQNGISVLDLPSPVSSYGPISGLKGSVSEAKLIDNTLYAVTTSGVYTLNLQPDAPRTSYFSQTTGLTNEAWAIARYNNAILAVYTEGVFLLQGSRSQKLNKQWNNSYCIYRGKQFRNRVYVGLERGVGILEENNGVWSDKGKLPVISTAIRTIAEDHHGNVWLGTTYNGIYKVSYPLAGNRDSVLVVHYDNTVFNTTKEVRILELTNELLFSSPNGVVRFNYTTGKFEQETVLGLNTFLAGSELMYLLQDSAGILWVSAANERSEMVIAAGIPETGGKYKWRNLSFLKSAIDFANSNAVFSIVKDEQTGNVFFSGADGIVQLNSRMFFETSSTQVSALPAIRRILLNTDSLLFAGDNRTMNLPGVISQVSVPYNFSALRIEYSSMDYSGALCFYSYKLEGLDEQWSNWQQETKKDYNALPPGTYTFKVRVKDIYDRISNEAALTFTVTTPWYLSGYAYTVYVVLFIGLIYGVYILRFRYLISRNLRLEKIIAERTRLISNQAEKLQQLDEIKSRFFANISHEFRTPLTLILGQIESVLTLSTDSKIKKKLEMGHRNAGRVLQLINQLLELSKIEAGKYSLTITAVSVVPFLKRLLYSFESFADTKGLLLEFQCSEEDLVLYCDTEKTEKVFINLISNAVKFSGEGGKIGITAEKTKALSLEEEEIIKITVWDYGIGIPKDRIPFIFDRFYQIEREGRSEMEGTGIGLTLVKEFIELHKARIEVESELGKGSRFILSYRSGNAHFSESNHRIKTEESDSAQELTEFVSSAEYEPQTEKLPAEKDTILIIDDNADIRQFIREQLEELYVIYEAADGEQGIQTAVGVIPTLVLTDVRMPGMDGFELSRRLKENPLTCHIPVIILTAKADKQDKIEGLKTGADDYLVKPFSPTELLLRVKNLIAVRATLREKYSKNRVFVPAEVTESGVEQQFLHDVLAQIVKNIADENFTADILAKKMSISLSQLNRKLNALLGHPAGQLIRQVRMEKAAGMLSAKQGSIKEIAYSVGYSDQSNFARTFKKHYGVTPGEYLEQK